MMRLPVEKKKMRSAETETFPGHAVQPRIQASVPQKSSDPQAKSAAWRRASPPADRAGSRIRVGSDGKKIAARAAPASGVVRKLSERLFARITRASGAIVEWGLKADSGEKHCPVLLCDYFGAALGIVAHGLLLILTRAADRSGRCKRQGFRRRRIWNVKLLRVNKFRQNGVVLRVDIEGVSKR